MRSLGWSFREFTSIDRKPLNGAVGLILRCGIVGSFIQLGITPLGFAMTIQSAILNRAHS